MRSAVLTFSGDALLASYHLGAGASVIQRALASNRPVTHIVGCSSGSLLAAGFVGQLGGAEFRPHQALAHLIRFGRDLRRPDLVCARELRRARHFSNPFETVLNRVLDSGLIDYEAVLRSPTNLIVTGARIHSQTIQRCGRLALETLRAGWNVFRNGHDPEAAFTAAMSGLTLVASGAVTPVYFSTHALSTDVQNWIRSRGGEYQQIVDPAGLREALRHSTRMPIIFGRPVDGIIDGAFADCSAVPLALQLGSDDVYGFTSSPNGHFFERPIQGAVLRQTSRIARSAARLRFVAETLPLERPIQLTEEDDARFQRVHPSRRLRGLRFVSLGRAVHHADFKTGRATGEQIAV